MLNVVITGSNGFIGKNLKVKLQNRGDIALRYITRSTEQEEYKKILSDARIVFHLAGINRPEKEKDFLTGNVGLTKELLKALPSGGCKFVFSSSTQAKKDNAYGRSKRQAEDVIKKAAGSGMVEAFIYRLPGVFGKWCKPNYNSVVATFCHQVAKGSEIDVHDPESKVQLVYIDDVVNKFTSLINDETRAGKIDERYVEPVYNTTVGRLADKIKKFKSIRPALYLPEVENDFEKKLYSTYLSYLPDNDFSYFPEVYEDSRGRLFEWIKSESFGQVFISNTKPNVTRGNHFHYTKTEKFLVIQGEGIIRFRKIGADEVTEYKVSGSKPEVVDIPPGYTHNLTNIGNKDMITLFWANEIFDEDSPDTIYEEV